MWLPSIKIDSRFVQTSSLIGLLITGLFWLFGDLSDICNLIVTCFFWTFLAIPVGMLLFWAPYKFAGGLTSLRTYQQDVLLADPSAYLDIIVKQVIIYRRPENQGGYAEIEFKISNGTVFPLNFECGRIETKITMDQSPIMLPKEADIHGGRSALLLPPGRNDNRLQVRQDFRQEVVGKLLEGQGHPIIWSFFIHVKFTFGNNLSGTKRYCPQWEGTNDAIHDGEPKE